MAAMWTQGLLPCAHLCRGSNRKAPSLLSPSSFPRPQRLDLPVPRSRAARASLSSGASPSVPAQDETKQQPESLIPGSEVSGTEIPASDIPRSEASDDVPASSSMRKAALHQALQQLSEESLVNVARKYSLHEELFSELDFARINAFTLSAFGGNPAAVVYLPYMPSEGWLQQVAAEFDLSETAYIVRRRGRPTAPGPDPTAAPAPSGGLLQRSADGSSVKGVAAGLAKGREVPQPLRGNEFELRWFTPKMEVRLCGHATLASAHLLFTAGLLEPGCDTVVFHTLSGALSARRVPEEETLLPLHSTAVTADAGEGRSSERQGQEQGALLQAQGKTSKGGQTGSKSAKPRKGVGIIELSFPLLPVVPLEEGEWAAIEAALALPPGSLIWAGRNSVHYILAEVRSQETVLQAEPDMAAVSQLPVVGIMLTALSPRHCGPGSETSDSSSEGGKEGHSNLESADFVTRFFAPQAGINEDPVTGSAFCSLGPYYAARLGRSELVGFQASARGGMVAVRVEEASQQVHLQGWAVLVQAGVLLNTIGPGAFTTA